MQASTRTAKEIQAHLKEAMGLLTTLRDEIRVEVHLATMDAKTQWSKLEARYEQAEQCAHTLTHDSQAFVLTTIEAFQSF